MSSSESATDFINRTKESINSIAEELKNDFEKMQKAQDVGSIKRPTIDEAPSPSHFAEKVKEYISYVPMRDKLSELNRLQSTVNFYLLDPKKNKSQKFNGYGFADLYNFLSIDSFLSEEEKEKQMPWTKNYVDDNGFENVDYGSNNFGNALLNAYAESNPITQLQRAHHLADEISKSLKGDETVYYLKNNSKFMALGAILQNIDQFRKKNKNLLDNYFIPEDNNTGIAKYRLENYDKILSDFYESTVMKDAIKKNRKKWRLDKKSQKEPFTPSKDGVIKIDEEYIKSILNSLKKDASKQ